MEDITTIEIDKESLKFSAAHFSIFSAEDRERLHGHNFNVYLAITVPIGPNGMCFSYKKLKDKIRYECEKLDEYTLIASNSPHLKISEEGKYYAIEFNHETILLLQSDTLLLPVRNTTVEEFAHYLLSQLLTDREFLTDYDVKSLRIKVSSGPGQSGSASWTKNFQS
jgi:6-pyruvoyltetrahydropterin/6-carboxytetrahydropterin synthase